MKDTPVKLTPMFEQYHAIKAEYEKALLFYRMGDFYELFFDDAKIAAKELQIALTSRNAQAENPVPMCGVPHHAAENYISQLLDKGYTVAICDQTSDPKASKGLVERAVTLVRTPATALEDASLTAKASNFLGALYWDNTISSGGFAWMEYSTGAWSGIRVKKISELWQWVQKIHPRELIIPDVSSDVFKVPSTIDLEDISLVRVPKRSYFDESSSIDRIKKAQRVQDLEALGLEGKPELIRACGALLAYLIQTQKQEITHLAAFSPLQLGQHMIIDEVTERNLELFRRFDGKKGKGTLWHAIDSTVTPMGGRLLEERLRNPWRDVTKIKKTADVVEFFFKNDHKREALRSALNSVYDLERLSTRIVTNRFIPRDVIALRESMASITRVGEALQKSRLGVYETAEESSVDALPESLNQLVTNWDDLGDIAGLLYKALVDCPPTTITEGGLFNAGFNKELDELLDLAENGENRMQELLAKEQAMNSFPKLKLGYNRVFGYYFELSRSGAIEIPEHFIRRQTLANAERFITPELKELEEKVQEASGRRNQLEHMLFLEIRKKILEAKDRIMFMASVMAALDYWQGLAETARKGNWVRPILHDGADVLIRQGRHPVVESIAQQADFIPNDLRLDKNRQLILITGPNMSGKSTVLRQMAIITILAQIGAYVPATEAYIGVVDRVFSRVGASDNLAQGQSTFMVEMMETARILRQATKKSLVILDEIGRGTSTFDGLALAWAVVENLLQRPEGTIRTLFATHYHELTSLEGRISGVHNMNIACKEWNGDIIFLHRLIPGPADRSYGIEVAKLAGVPQTVVKRAKKILEALTTSKRTAGVQEAEQVMQQMLPGFSPVENEPERPILPEKIADVEHPLITALKDINADAVTPMEALSLIHEWKQLWGETKQ